MFVEDLEAWEKKANVKVGPGDVILLRTGRWARRAKIGPWNVGQNEAGYHASTAPWMKARGVSFIASDVAQDVTPSLVEGMQLPIHTLAITAMGIDIMDNMDLEALAETCARLNRWEFLLAGLAGSGCTWWNGVPGGSARDFLSGYAGWGARTLRRWQCAARSALQARRIPAVRSTARHRL